MKILIVYDSLFGNTLNIAVAIGEGFTGSDVKLRPVKEFDLQDLEGVKLLMVGSPTHAGGPSQDIKQFFKRLPANALQGKKAAAFDTGIPADDQQGIVRLFIKVFGYASPQIVKKLQKKGAVVMADETFFVLDKEGPLKEGELERARKWGQGLAKSV